MSNKFIKKFLGQGEMDIRDIKDLRPPTEKEKEYIKKKVEKNAKTEAVSSAFWGSVSAFFVGMYLFLVVFGEEKNRAVPLFMACVFVVLTAACWYRIIRCREIKRKIREEKYQMKDVTIHHLVPGFSLSHATAKIKDEKEVVYSYEFVLNRKQKKLYKKDKNQKFLLLDVGNKKDYSLLIPMQD